MARPNHLLTVRIPRFLAAQMDDARQAVKYLASRERKFGLAEYLHGLSDHPFVGDEAYEETILSRLVRAYALAKKDQRLAGSPFERLGEWERIIGVEYARLLHALGKNDLTLLKQLLQNFFRNECSRGFETNYVHRNPRRPLQQFWYINRFNEAYRLWGSVSRESFNAKDFSVPTVGNPFGMKLGDHLVPCVAIRHRYYARELLRLMGDADSTCVEIGGGFGGLAYFLLKEATAKLCYLNFDLPEINAVNGYFLLKTFPHKRIVLYGEGRAELRENMQEADIMVCPHFSFSRLPDRSADLVFNANSLSEMDETMVSHYFCEIKRVSRRYFMHVNHDDETMYDPVKKKKHIKLSSYTLEPEFRTLVHKKPSFYNPTYFEYLYQR